MTEEAALLGAITAQADDDTPRLVYADWLEENGCAEEAEFIRVECRLSATAPDDDEYSDLLDRREELRLWLTAHQPGPEMRLSSGLCLEGGADWWNTTHRGFPRFLEFEALNRSGVKPIRALAAALDKAFTRLPTRWLSVRFITVAQLAELLRQPIVADLDHLTVQLDAADDPQEEACRLIADCPNLRNLRGLFLSFSPGEAGAASLASSAHLAPHALAFDSQAWCTPGEIRALGAAAWLRGLRSLTLGNLEAAAFDQLARLDDLVNLHTLKLDGPAFPNPSWRTFARSRSFPRLAHLTCEMDMSNGQAEELAGATEFRLSILDLGGCVIGNDGARALARAPWLESLCRLDLSYNLMTAAGFAAISTCRRLTRLKYLDLSYNSPGVRGLRGLASNPALRGLTTLLLNGTFEDSRGLSSAQFQRFFEEMNMPQLRRLELTQRPLGARAARALTANKFASLTRLHLDQCKLTDAAMAALVDAPALQHLIEFDATLNGLRAGVAALANRSVMPRLSAANFSANRIPRDLARKLKRRPGVSA